MKRLTKPLAVAGTVVAVVAVAGGTATAASMITSAQIKDGGVHNVDLGSGVQSALSKKSVNNLIVGAGYAGLGGHDYWAAHSFGQTVEQCPAGQFAIGGGFSQDASTGGPVDGDAHYDMGGKTDVQITVSAPYFEGEYKPVDDAGNFRADQWIVRGYNNSDQQVDVRAWVVCADAN
jgi:hypothetical protein